MVGFLFFLFGVLVTLGFCILAAMSDFRGFKIPNYVSLFIAGTFGVAYAVLTLTEQREFVFMSITSHLGAAALTFVVTGALFALKQLGAGDSKFATAVSLWFGLSGLVPFLFYMALSGGIIGVASLLLRKYKPLKSPPAGSWPAKAQEGSPSVPYGIAIAIGTLAAFFFQGYFSLGNWEKFF